MKTNNHHSLTLIPAAILCALAFTGVAGAQSVHHDRLDARAAAKDMVRLERDRARAARHHEWKKVAQDDRLIAADRKWIRRDVRKVERARGY